MRCGQERRNGGREVGKRKKRERKREEKREVVEELEKDRSGKGGKGWRMRMKEIEIRELKSVKLNAPVMIEGLPGVGNVGKLVVEHMIEELHA